MTKNLQTGWHFSIPKYPSLRPRPYLLYDLYCTDLFIWIDLLPRTIRQSPCIAFNLMRVVHKFAPVISAPREWVMKCERGNNISIRFGDSRFLGFPRFSDSGDLRCSWDQVVSFCVESFLISRIWSHSASSSQTSQFRFSFSVSACWQPRECLLIAWSLCSHVLPPKSIRITFEGLLLKNRSIRFSGINFRQFLRCFPIHVLVYGLRSTLHLMVSTR